MEVVRGGEGHAVEGFGAVEGYEEGVGLGEGEEGVG